jgi:lysozyme family protein
VVYFIGCIHALESSFDFQTHLFNGDPLTARTVHVPAGQPVAPPASGAGYSWEESATAAMKLKEFDRANDWSLPRLLYRWERYNGMGYRAQGVPTPYL